MKKNLEKKWTAEDDDMFQTVINLFPLASINDTPKDLAIRRAMKWLFEARVRLGGPEKEYHPNH